MSHDLPSASASAPGPSTSRQHGGNADDNHDDEGRAAYEQRQREERLRRAKERVRIHKTHKGVFLQDLLFHLDVLIYAEICILYYMDCSFTRLFLRSITQLSFLTPKPPPSTTNIPQPAPSQPAILGIFIPNALCMLLHIFTAHSAGSEISRGYLHGGLIIDFIGYRGPTSKVHLVLLDILVMVLQCFMLCVVCEDFENRKRDDTNAGGSGTGTSTGQGQVSGQDIDAEERGMLREVSVTADGAIEMQYMASSASNPSAHGALLPENTGVEEDERSNLLREANEDDEPLSAIDVFQAGMAVIGEFNVVDTLRRQWGAREYQDASGRVFGARTAMAVLRQRMEESMSGTTAR